MEIDFKVIKLVEQIVYRSLMINQRHQNTVFFNFSGHVNWFEISIFLEGWKEGKNPDLEEKISFNIDDNISERLINISNYLKKIGFEDEEGDVVAEEDFDVFQLIDEERNLDNYRENKEEK